MSASHTADAIYVMGRSEAEERRLRQQAEVYAPSTRRLLEDAGITTGMKVLDIGSGAGDVALLVADLVGSSGTVVGIDTNPAILDTARVRVRAAGLTNVSFIEGDIRAVTLDRDFDAVVGRLILLYLGNPAEVLRRAASHLRPGGIVAFQEADFTNGPVEVPPSRLDQQMWTWWRQTVSRAGLELAMGFKLYQAFLAAGLPAPQMRLDAPLGGGPDWAGYAYIAESIRSILPLMLKFGVATAEEVDIDTLAARFRDEVVRQQGVVMLPTFVGAWARTP
jgi:ubiquinone/menaquinone biosynthesis C-methylase UbiE